MFKSSHWKLRIGAVIVAIFIIPALGVSPAFGQLRFGVIGDSISTGMDTDGRCYDAWECLDNVGEDTNWSHTAGDRYYSWGTRLAPYGWQRGVIAAKNGAKWDDAMAQIEQIFTQDPGTMGILVLLGGNDVCGPRGEALPSLQDISWEIDNAAMYMATHAPGGVIVIEKVPDVVHLRNMAQYTDAGLFDTCQDTWDLNYNHLKLPSWYRSFVASIIEPVVDDVFGDQFPCSNILSSQATAQERAAAQAYNYALNDLIQSKVDYLWEVNHDADAHNDIPLTAYIAGSIGSYPFRRVHISDIDCFHPSREGQELFGNLSWSDIFE